MSKKQKRNLNKRLSENNYTELNKQQKIDVLSIIVVGCPHINFQSSDKWLVSKYEREETIDLVVEFSTDLEEKYSKQYIRQLFSDTKYEDLVFDWTDLQLDYFFEYNNEVTIAIGDSYKKLGIEKLEVFEVVDLINKLLQFEEEELGHQYSVLKKYSKNTELVV